MARYELYGNYEYNGSGGSLEGILEVNKEGKVKGDIYDHGSRNPEQKIQGEIQQLNGEAILSFTKYPPNVALANLLYGLKRVGEGNTDDFAGDYEGKWHALPRETAQIIQEG